jgi:hypothetical protein
MPDTHRAQGKVEAKGKFTEQEVAAMSNVD